MSFDPDTPYNDLPPLPPRCELETRAVLKKAIGASTALAELRGVGGQIPNQAVLIQAIGLQEAKLSSEIENVVTTNDELYRAFADDGLFADPHTKEVLHYKDALWFGYQEVCSGKRMLSTSLFDELYQIVKLTTGGVRKGPGTKLVNPMREVIYTPPEGETAIRDLLDNLSAFMYAEDDLDPLVKMAVMHYQFEAIHPFPDGNGRTGRILNILFLLERKLLDIPVLYLSRHIIDNKSGYYEGLRRVTEEAAWEPWVLYMLDAVEKTAIHTRERILAIRVLMDKAIALVREKEPKIYSKDLLEVVFRHPYCKISFLVESGITGSRQTASKYLHALADCGLLKPFKRGTEIYFLNAGLFDILAKG